MRCGRDRIDSGVAPSGVSASPADVDDKIAEERGPRAGRNPGFAEVSIWIDMQRQDAINVFACAGLHQLVSTLTFFFGRLEDGTPREWQIAFLFQCKNGG